MPDARLPLLHLADLHERAERLPADLRLTLRTPLRVKSHGAFISRIDLPAIVQAACWRIDTLATYYGDGPWEDSYRPLVDHAAAVPVSGAVARWEDWERTSTRGHTPHSMKLGGIVGEALLHAVPPEIRAVLLAAGIVHVGKACVFGHGLLTLDPAGPLAADTLA